LPSKATARARIAHPGEAHRLALVLGRIPPAGERQRLHEQVAISHQDGHRDGQHHQRLASCRGDTPGGQAEHQEEQGGEGDRDAELDTEGVGRAGQRVRRGGDKQEESRPDLRASDEARELQHVTREEGVGGLDLDHRSPGGVARQRVAVGDLGEHGREA
jgi:hypothetical protein